MNLLQVKTLDKLQCDLEDILNRCMARDAIVTHFSQYLLGQMTLGHIEDYQFFPNVTTSGTDVTVHIYFNWDNMARHELLIVKDDSLGAAYTRAMGIV